MSLLRPELLTLIADRYINHSKIDGTVYYIACPETLRVKIGFTNGSPAARLRALRTGSPTDIRLIAIHPGTHDDEQRIHRWFADQRMRGEWFEVDETLFQLFSYIALTAATCALHRGLEVPKWAQKGLDAMHLEAAEMEAGRLH